MVPTAPTVQKRSRAEEKTKDKDWKGGRGGEVKRERRWIREEIRMYRMVIKRPRFLSLLRLARVSVPLLRLPRSARLFGH